MKRDELMWVLAKYFPRLFLPSAEFLQQEVAAIIIDRLLRIEKEPLTCTQLNQVLHMADEAGISEGFFKFYFLGCPEGHPHAVQKLLVEPPETTSSGIDSLRQIRWGLHRFFVDALLYFGNIRAAYQELRQKSYEEIVTFFSDKRFDSDTMAKRGAVLPFHAIPVDDRYLIAEMACKAYTPAPNGAARLIEQTLVKAYRDTGGGKTCIKSLFDQDSRLAKSDPQAQMMLRFTTEEFADDTVSSEEEIHTKVEAVAKRFVRARELAIANTRLYLSIVNELDVYVATSMRKRSDFRDMNRDSARIFGQEALRKLRVRYFDPTISAADGHEDKGLIECLMVKCAKALIYFAGEEDSFGKDAEVSMALSLGKPVIILCPATEKGEQRMKFFRDIHPLSRLIQMETGMPVGATITNDPLTAAKLLERIFNNQMEYDLELSEDGYLRLTERLTQSVVRLQTNFRMLRESFANYYHHIG
jgi:hypothetical protein